MRSVWISAAVCGLVLAVSAPAFADESSSLIVINNRDKPTTCWLKKNGETITNVTAASKRSATKPFTTRATGHLKLECKSNGKSVSWTNRIHANMLGEKNVRVRCQPGPNMSSCTPETPAKSGGSSTSNGSNSSGSASGGGGRRDSTPSAGTVSGASSRMEIRNDTNTTLTCLILNGAVELGKLVIPKNQTKARTLTTAFAPLLKLVCKRPGKSIVVMTFNSNDLKTQTLSANCFASSGGLKCNGRFKNKPGQSGSSGSNNSAPASTPSSGGQDKTLTFTMKNEFNDAVSCTLKSGATVLATLSVPKKDSSGKSTSFAVPDTDFIKLQCTSGSKQSPQQSISASGLRSGDATKVSGSCYSGGSLTCNANAR